MLIDMRFPVIKSLTILTIIVSIGLSSCKGNSGQNITELKNERDSLLILANENQRELTQMNTFFEEVSSCLDSISEQERLLVVKSEVEGNGKYGKADIIQRLNQLHQIITGQHQRITSLVDSLDDNSDTTRLAGLRNTISYLTNQLKQKEEQIERLKAEIRGQQRSIRSLNAKVGNLNNEVSILNDKNTALTEAVKVQSQIINEGYVLVASTNQLKEMGIIEGGGFLKKSKVNIGKVNKQNCSKVDITHFKELTINSKKVKLLTPAPSSSYAINKNGSVSVFTILDASSFWSLSNVLVIQIQ